MEVVQVLHKCVKLFSEYFPFWDKLSEQQKEKLCSSIVFVKYNKGQNIHGASGECTGVIFLKSGIMRAYLLSEEGKEVTLYRLYSGDICMLSAACAIQNITFDVFIDAEEECEAYIISSKVFSELMSECIEAENFALRTTTARFSDVIWAMQQILFMSFDKRLAVFLIDELAKNGSDTIKMTQEQIAKYMGSAREVVSRMLKYFAFEGIVEVSRGGVKVIDKNRLRNIAF
jgi:CRP/FNR family transcriptional regulator